MNGGAYRSLEEGGRSDWSILPRLLRYVVPHRLLFGSSMFILALSSAAALGPILVLPHIIDDGIEKKDPDALREKARSGNVPAIAFLSAGHVEDTHGPAATHGLTVETWIRVHAYRVSDEIE